MRRSRPVVATTVIAAFVIALLAGSGCARAPQSEPVTQGAPPLGATLTVFAAASLTDCLDAFNEEFLAGHPGLDIRANYAGTQELKVQAEQGAAFDVFACASEKHMQDLVKEGLVADPRAVALNYLCVAVDPNSTKVSELADLAKPDLALVVATDTCPAGKYTRDCWQLMEKSEAFGPEFVQRMQANVVSEETNVKLVLSKVALGEADAGFVYCSDLVGQSVTRLDLPEDVQVEATYTVGAAGATTQQELAAEYIAALTGDLGRRHLKAAGLAVPGDR